MIFPYTRAMCMGRLGGMLKLVVDWHSIKITILPPISKEISFALSMNRTLLSAFMVTGTPLGSSMPSNAR